MPNDIDRLELDDAGELVVTDYKTGRAPPPNYEQRRLDGVQFYSLLCESNFGKRPARSRQTRQETRNLGASRL